jgi:hypothetical protein
MSWPEFMAARQLLTAEGVGKTLRAARAPRTTTSRRPSDW